MPYNHNHDNKKEADVLCKCAQESRSWPFEEARKLVHRFEKDKEIPKVVVFETGYGPSGLPHIGTFGEVVRTAIVQKAFQALMPGVATKLICFSDDMDSLRKVPENVPNRAMMEKNIGKPLTVVPDPFGTHDSFGAHNNAKLCAFLDKYDFHYVLISATKFYKSGVFNDALMRVLEKYDEIMDIMLPSLRKERKETYSPILPISPHDGRVLMVPLLERDSKKGSISFQDPATGKIETINTKDGACKLQWKVDWAMRWFALCVHYEMSGKDLIDSVKLSRRICLTLGGKPPECFSYELFLDEDGRKISKSKGNGFSVDDWLTYADEKSLRYFMYKSPRVAKKLCLDVVPKSVDHYIGDLQVFCEQSLDQKINNPVWHIHGGSVPDCQISSLLNFSLLLNLVCASGTSNVSVLWGFVRRYYPSISPETHAYLDQLIHYAVRYFEDFIKPNLSFRKPLDFERIAMQELICALKDHTRYTGHAEEELDSAQIMSAEDYQKIVYDVGKKHFVELREWFCALYEVLLGQKSGPRFGSLIALYGAEKIISLIEEKLTLSI